MSEVDGLAFYHGCISLDVYIPKEPPPVGHRLHAGGLPNADFPSPEVPYLLSPPPYMPCPLSYPVLRSGNMCRCPKLTSSRSSPPPLLPTDHLPPLSLPKP